MNSKFAAPYLSMSVAPYFILFCEAKTREKIERFFSTKKINNQILFELLFFVVISINEEISKQSLLFFTFTNFNCTFTEFFEMAG